MENFMNTLFSIDWNTIGNIVTGILIIVIIVCVIIREVRKRNQSEEEDRDAKYLQDIERRKIEYDRELKEEAARKKKEMQELEERIYHPEVPNISEEMDN